MLVLEWRFAVAFVYAGAREGRSLGWHVLNDNDIHGHGNLFMSKMRKGKVSIVTYLSTMRLPYDIAKFLGYEIPPALAHHG